MRMVIRLSCAGRGRDEIVPIVCKSVRSLHARVAGMRVAVRNLGTPMIERRRVERFHLVDAGVGTLRIVQDVEITQLASRHAVVIAPGPLPAGERLLLEIFGECHAPPCTVLVRVLDNRVVMDDGSLRRQVRLEMIPRAPRDLGFQGVQISRGQSAIGALIRRVPVRVVEASTAGCVFDSPSVVVEGSVGFVRLRTIHQEHSEAMRVRRTSKTSDRVWQHRMAAEFLTLGLRSPDMYSLRGLAAIMTASAFTATDSDF
jgi:hypothetical protein